MFRWIFWNFLYGMVTPSRSVYVHNDVNVDVEGSDGYSIDGDNCDYAADDTCYDGGSDSGGD